MLDTKYKGSVHPVEQCETSSFWTEKVAFVTMLAYWARFCWR